jgi:hypothetical protein
MNGHNSRANILFTGKKPVKFHPVQEFFQPLEFFLNFLKGLLVLLFQTQVEKDLNFLQLGTGRFPLADALKQFPSFFQDNLSLFRIFPKVALGDYFFQFG